MIHLIRNGVDRALEPPQERQAAGKPVRGRITLTAGHEGDRVMIRVSDDGRGLDRDRILHTGIKAGLVPAGTSPDDPRVDTLIFEPGFSTRDQVSELSGRGVGPGRGPRRRARTAWEHRRREHARPGNFVHLPAAVDPGLDRRPARRIGRQPLRRPPGTG